LPDDPTESAAPEVGSVLSRAETLFKPFHTPSRTLEGIPKGILRSLTKVADISVRLESAHMEQRRSIATILKTGSHYWQTHPPIASPAHDCATPVGQPVRTGSRLQPDFVDAALGETVRQLGLVVSESKLVKKVDDLFQRVCYLSPLEGTRVLTITGYGYNHYRRGVQVSGAGYKHEKAVLGNGTFGPSACFCRPTDGFQFIFLPLLFVTVRPLISALLLSNC